MTSKKMQNNFRQRNSCSFPRVLPSQTCGILRVSVHALFYAGCLDYIIISFYCFNNCVCVCGDYLACAWAYRGQRLTFSTFLHHLPPKCLDRVSTAHGDNHLDLAGTARVIGFCRHSWILYSSWGSKFKFSC